MKEAKERSTKTSRFSVSPEPAMRTAGSSPAPAAASQPPPADESPSLQTAPHAEPKLGSRSDPAASDCVEPTNNKKQKSGVKYIECRWFVKLVSCDLDLTFFRIL